MQLKYQAVYDYINELINNQEPNTMIPSERVLSETLDISRMTVRKAIDIMVQEGKLYRKIILVHSFLITAYTKYTIHLQVSVTK